MGRHPQSKQIAAVLQEFGKQDWFPDRRQQTPQRDSELKFNSTFVKRNFNEIDNNSLLIFSWL